MNRYDYSDVSKRSLNTIFDFTSLANPLGPSRQAEHAVRKEAGRLESFPDVKARYLRRYLSRTEKVSEEHIVFGAGSTHLLKTIMDVMAPERIIALSPASARIETIPERHRRRMTLVALDEERGFAVSVVRLLGEMKEGEMIIVGNPHDLTGSSLSQDDLRLLILEAGKRGAVLVIDEAVREYTNLASPVQETVQSPSTVILRTFSHYYGLAGLRLGYAIGPLRLIERIDEDHPGEEIGAPALYAAQAALRDRDHRARTRKFIDAEKAYFRQKFGGLTGVEIIDTPCNFLLLRLEGEWEHIYKSFLECHIIVTAFPGESGAAYVRLPVGRHKSNAYFARALRRITGG